MKQSSTNQRADLSKIALHLRLSGGLTGEQSGSQTHTVATEGVSLCVRMKS
jgi:hypothetical protein